MGHGAKASVGPPVPPRLDALEAEIRLDQHLRFKGGPPEAERLLLEVDSALERGEKPALRLLYEHEEALRREATLPETAGPGRDPGSRARQDLAELLRHRAVLRAELEVFLLDPRFRRNADPYPCAAGMCLTALIDGRASRASDDEDRIKFDIWTHGPKPLIGAFWLSRAEFAEDLWEGEGSVRERFLELLKYQSEIVTFLPPQIRLRHAYPAIVRSLAGVAAKMELREEWLAPLNWNFGLG